MVICFPPELCMLSYRYRQKPEAIKPTLIKKNQQTVDTWLNIYLRRIYLTNLPLWFHQKPAKEKIFYCYLDEKTQRTEHATRQ